MARAGERHPFEQLRRGRTTPAPQSDPTGQLLAAQDQERRRIARELHDGTASTLVALSLDLARLVDLLRAGKARDLAVSCASLCEQALQELRTVAFVLHPPLLEPDGLRVALERLADGFSKRSGIRVTYEAARTEWVRLSPRGEVTLYRIAQEALSNVLRHSGSRTAHVALSASGCDVRLTVRDEGTLATRQSGASPGVGIASMRERLRELGGRLRLAFGDGGTSMTAVLPQAPRPRDPPASPPPGRPARDRRSRAGAAPSTTRRHRRRSPSPTPSETLAHGSTSRCRMA